MNNFGKNPVFSPEERISIICDSLGLDSSSGVPVKSAIEVIYYEGLLISLYEETGAAAVVRGIRSESDYRNEAEMNAVNRLMYPTFDTILLPCHANFAYTSSSVVREVASYGGDISGMVCASALDSILRKVPSSAKRRMEDRKL